MFPTRFVHLEEARRRFGARVDRLGAFLDAGDPLADAAVEVLAGRSSEERERFGSFRELDFVHDLTATGTFLPETLRDLALFFALGLKRGFFENGHGLTAGGGHRVNRTGPSFA